MIVFGLRLPRAEPWRPVAWYSLAAAAIAVANLAAFLAGGGSFFLFAFFANLLAWLTVVAARAFSLASVREPRLQAEAGE
jgi:hypothetical protein